MPETDKAPGAEEPKPIPYRDHNKARPYLVGLSAVAGFLFTLVLSNDYCCSALGAAIIGAVGVYIVDYVFCVTPIVRHRHRMWMRFTVALIIPLLLALSPLFRLGKEEAFELAFGLKPPPGVSDLVVERHYEGGPGDYTLLLQFTADPATIEQITSHREFAPYEDLAALWDEVNGNWSAFVDALHGYAARPGWWQQLKPMRNPDILQWWPQGKARGTLLLWDPQSGTAYAAHWLG